MNTRLKRMLDVVLAALAIVALSPLLVALALWIRLDSPGPALFRQRRIGRNGAPFRVLKFRTMHHRDPDSIDQLKEAVVSAGEDPRITQAGRFLRRTSLDELPLLFNILKGEMSLVGPRPLLPEQVEVVPPEYSCRFEVRPGLTGLAQVRGRRGLAWLDQLAADAEYVRRHNLLYDLRLIAKTAQVVLTGSGVYGGEGQNWRAYRDARNAEAADRCQQP